MIMMEKVKNAWQHLKEKIGAKLNQKPTTVEEPVRDIESWVIVSDLAVQQGAPCNQPTGDEVLDRYHWMNRADLKELYHISSDGTRIPNYFLEHPVGMRPVLENAFYHKLQVQGSFLTYNQAYVMFPQKQVEPALSDRLTQLALGKVVVPESEFGPLSYQMKQYGKERQQGIENASYYYQGQAYCARVDRQNQTAPVQWFRISPVMAEKVEDTVYCSEVLIADICYQPDKILDDFKNSVSINHEIPLMYTRTPWPKGIGDDPNEMQK